ncbi:MAG: rRNA maturation RNase YbeY [Christensenellales bacterium]
MINFCGVPFKFRRIIKKVFRAVEEYFGIQGIFSVEIVFYDGDSMRELNNRMRNIDKKTDVLSFPSLEIKREFPIKADILTPEVFDGKRYSLGSIVICPEVMSAQAKEYGHGEDREIAFLASHGFLHLLGYDHMDSEEEKEMREHQENILKPLGFVR